MAQQNDTNSMQTVSMVARVKKPKVRTVLGDIDMDNMGITLIHEHVFWDFEPLWQDRSIAFSKAELQAAAVFGARTIVDVAPHPYRYPQWYLDLAPQTDVNIIVSTGFYLEKRVSPRIHSMSENDMIVHFRHEIITGIRNSSLKAGVIKVAGAGPQLTPWEQKVMCAAAHVNRELGVPVCTHAIEGALAQFYTLLAAGADPQRIYLSHTEQEIGWEGRSVEGQISYLLEIVRQGGSLYFSTFGWEFLSQGENLKHLILTLCEKGFQSHLLISADANYKVDQDGNTWWEEQKDHPELPQKNYSHTFTYTLPLLKSWGFSDMDIKGFLVDNPGAMFSTARF